MAKGGVKELQVGLIGCGTVGGAFAAVLAERRAAIDSKYGVRLRLVEVAVARPEVPRPTASGARVHGDPLRIAGDSSIPIVVEASGAAAGASWLKSALERGAVVVTAHKQALAHDAELLRALGRHEPRLQCEAAVAGGVPIVRALRESLAGDDVLGIRGVLNGTTTFVLSGLEEGESLPAMIRAAQQAGYAEADPSQDLDGSDAAAKLAILATLAWREPVSFANVARHGIDAGAEELVREAGAQGKRVRLVARARRNGAVEARVEPELLDPTDPLAAVTDVQNAIEIRAAVAGPLVWRGAGAGGRATASALLADTLAAAHWLAGAAGRKDS